MNDELQPLLKAEKISRTFTLEGVEVRALAEVSLTINRGEIIGIIGSSGAGKSTLLQILGALDRPTTGTVHYESRDIYKMNESELAGFRCRSVGFVFQASNLLPEFNAVENVALAGMIAGLDKVQAIEKAADILGQLGLGERLNHRPGKLSGGEQQRVAIGRALVNEPSLILADEPTGNLDTGTGDQIMDLIFNLNKEQGRTFAIVTHNLALTKGMSKTVKIRDGKFVDTLNDVLELDASEAS